MVRLRSPSWVDVVGVSQDDSWHASCAQLPLFPRAPRIEWTSGVNWMLLHARSHSLCQVSYGTSWMHHAHVAGMSFATQLAVSPSPPSVR